MGAQQHWRELSVHLLAAWVAAGCRNR